MALDKQKAAELARFAKAFREARERSANEADTVMFLIRFFENVLGYDALKGEISKELAIKDRYCDVAMKVDGVVRVLVEVKAASIKPLSEKHIEQAENYASRAGLQWVLLTNGIEWLLYHLTFIEGEGIVHDVAFEANLVEEIEKDPEALWNKLDLLSIASVRRDALEDYWAQRKVLSPASVVKVLFHEDVLKMVRRFLHKDSEAMLDLSDVFNAVRDVISKEALTEAGDLGITKKRKRRRRIQKTDSATGRVTVVEEEQEENAPCEQPAPVGELQTTDSASTAPTDLGNKS